MLKFCQQSLGYPSVTQIIYILKWLTFVTNTNKITKTCRVCVCIIHSMQICMYTQVYLLAICQYAYKFLPKYLQSISIFFRLSFYIAFSWQKGHMETIGTYGRKDLLWDQIVVCLLILNNIQGIFLLWHKILCCEEVSQYRSCIYSHC